MLVYQCPRDSQLHEQQRAEKFRLMERGGVAHRGAPSPIIAVTDTARTHIVLHADAIEVCAVQVSLHSDTERRVGVDKEPRDGD